MPRGRGRPKLPESAAQYRYRQKHGYARHNASISAKVRLRRVVIKEGGLSEAQRALAASISAAPLTPHPGRSTIGGSRVGRLLHTAAEGDLTQLLASFGLEPKEVPPEDEPWDLTNSGPCPWHTDSGAKEACWTFLLCLDAEDPYEMYISAATGHTIYEGVTWRSITMSAGSYIIFSAKLWHKCEARVGSKRRIINVQCHKLK